MDTKIVKQICSDGEVVFEDGTTQVFSMDHEGVYYKVYFGEREKIFTVPNIFHFTNRQE